MPFRSLPLGVLVVSLLGFVGAKPTLADQAQWEQRFRGARNAQQQEVEKHLQGKQDLGPLIATYTSQFQNQRTPANAALVGRLMVFKGLQQRSAKLRDKHFETALKYFAEALRLQPSFWFARLGMTQVYLIQKDVGRAERALAPALRLKPREPGVLEMHVQLLLLKENWPSALAALETLVQLEPKNYKFHQMEAEIRFYQGKWESCVSKYEWLLRDVPESTFRKLNEMEWRRRAGLAYMQLRDYLKAERHLSRVVRAFPDRISVRAPLELCYLQLDKPAALLEQVDWLIAYLQKRLDQELARGAAGADKSAIQEQLATYRKKRHEVVKWVAAGSIPRSVRKPKPSAQAPEKPEDVLTVLMRTILTGSVPERRDALRTWLEQDIPGVPGALVTRFHPSVEPDGEARLLLGRIISRVDRVDLVPYFGFGVWDPDSRIRQLVSETLGKHRYRGSLLYLAEALQQEMFMERSGQLPMARRARERLEDEFNALRYALYRLTGFKDIEDPEQGRVSVNRVLAVRQRWLAYFDSPVGAAQLAEALGAFYDLDQHDPMPYVLPLTQHRRAFVVQAAYDMISRYKALVLKESKNPRARDAFGKFPVLAAGEEGFNEAWAQKARRAIRKWSDSIYVTFRMEAPRASEKDNEHGTIAPGDPSDER